MKNETDRAINHARANAARDAHALEKAHSDFAIAVEAARDASLTAALSAARDRAGAEHSRAWDKARADAARAADRDDSASIDIGIRK